MFGLNQKKDEMVIHIFNEEHFNIKKEKIIEIVKKKFPELETRTHKNENGDDVVYISSKKKELEIIYIPKLPKKKIKKDINKETLLFTLSHISSEDDLLTFIKEFIITERKEKSLGEQIFTISKIVRENQKKRPHYAFLKNFKEKEKFY